MICLKYIFKG